jgi:hypothetical protein
MSRSFLQLIFSSSLSCLELIICLLTDLIQKSTPSPSRTIYQTVPPRLLCGSSVPCLATLGSPYLTLIIFILSPTDSAFDYSARRMSGSTVSAAETDSSVASRPEKRPLSPSSSPQPYRPRPSLSAEHPSWDFHSTQNPQQDTKTVETGLDNSKVQLPSIFTTFEDPFRRASLPALSSESHSRYRSAPYPPTNPRRASHASNHQSNLGSYHFPPPSDTSEFADKPSGRPRLTADTHLNYSYGDSTSYLSTAISSTTPSSSHFSSPNFTSPLTPDIRSQGTPTSTYVESDSWNDSPSGIVRPSSTGQLPSGVNKYDDSIRHSSFSATPPQMYSGTPRLPAQQDRRLYPTSAPPRDDWNFSNQDYAYPSNNTTNSPIPSAAPVPATTSSPAPRSPPSAPSSTLVDRPMRKRGKLPKETTDYLKAWLHRHSDHPYPSEEEKKQLCNATGLSMSQVSNWMINVRLLLSFTAIQSIKPFAGSPPDFGTRPPSSTRTHHLCAISILHSLCASFSLRSGSAPCFTACRKFTVVSPHVSSVAPRRSWSPELSARRLWCNWSATPRSLITLQW